MSKERVTRRLAAILAADVVGYSRLMGRDEAGTLARLKAHRTERLDPAIGRHDGRVVKLTGDGVLVEFASAVEALAAAIEIQQAMAEANRDQPEDTRIVFRIGLHLGDLIVEGDDLYGDGVNVAARLEAEAPTGGIVISGNMHDAVIGRLDASFEDLGALALKNIERPVRAYGVLGPDDTEASFPAAGAISIDAPLALRDKPSIAVLPFQNMSGDPEQEYFADGIVEDIITALSRFKSLFVIARNSSFTYKGKAVDIKQVGRELGVRYILEGSVRKAGGRVRITGQLIEAATGAHVWADRFDGHLEDIFDIQDSVTTSVIGAIVPVLQRVEMDRAWRKPTESLDAYDSYLRGLSMYRQYTRQTNKRALELYYRAIELAPDFAAPHGAATHCYMVAKLHGWNYDPTLAESEVRRLSERVATIGQDDASALGAVGPAIAYVCREYDAGKTFADQAVALNPNFPVAWVQCGTVSILRSEHEKAIEQLSRVRLIAPLGHDLHLAQGLMSLSYLLTEKYDEAVANAVQVASNLPTWILGHFASAAAHAYLGKLDEARRSVSQICKLNIGLRVSNFSQTLSFRRTEDTARFKEGLRLAGMPD